MSDTSDAWRGWVKWYEIPKTPWTTGSNLNWIVPASPSDRTEFMIISQGQTHTWLYLRDRHRQNLPGGTDAMQKRNEKAKRHREDRRGGRHEAHSPSPIIYIEGIESPLIIGISVTSMPGRRMLSEGAVNNCAQLSTILQSQGFCLFLVVFFLPLQKQLLWIKSFANKPRDKLQLCLDFRAPQRTCFLDWMKGKINLLLNRSV